MSGPSAELRIGLRAPLTTMRTWTGLQDHSTYMPSIVATFAYAQKKHD